MSTPYGGNIAQAAGLALAGDAHIMYVGDSVQSESRSYTPAHTWNIPIIYPHLRWNYMVAPGGPTGATNNYSYNGSYASGGNITATSYGVGARTETTANADGPNLIRACRSLAFGAAVSGDFSPTLDTGITIQRAFASSVNAASGRRYPWPKHGVVGRPWFHDGDTAGDGYIKAKMIVGGRTAKLLEGVDIYLRRNPLSSGTGTANASAAVASNFVQPLEANYIESSWTAALADSGTYHTTSGDQYNDHNLQLGLSAQGAVDESGKVLDVYAGVFARCNSGGTIGTNARGASCGYDAFGRPSSYVGDWYSAYATEADWVQYFTYTVINPLKITVMVLDFGRNLNVTGSAEATGGVANAGFSTNYQGFIDKLNTAYHSAHPTGRLYIILKVPPRCSAVANGNQTQAQGDALQTRIEALAAANGQSWMSQYLYFNRLSPIRELHPTDDLDGIMLATADRDMMDRATNFRYSTLGMAGGSSAPRNRR